MRRALPLLALLLPLAACRSVAPETMAAAPPEPFWVEYYQISEK